jgi:hypothetical protein
VKRWPALITLTIAAEVSWLLWQAIARVVVATAQIILGRQG